MFGHETKSRRVWCQGEDIEKVKEDQGRIETKTLLRQVAIEVTALPQQAKGLRRQKIEE